jgi:t-SNARE complex subunit (syntaxin)
MQERDEDLYQAYQDIEKLEKKNAAQSKKIIILSFILGIIVLLIVVFIFFKVKTGGITPLLKLLR